MTNQAQSKQQFQSRYIAELEHKIETCGLQCSATMKSLLAEIELLRTALRGVQSCGGCGACRGAATLALGGVTPEPAVAIPFTHWSKDPLCPYDGCYCSSCNEARNFVADVSGSSQPPRDEQG